MTGIFSHWRCSARGSRKNVRRPVSRRLPLGVEVLETRLTPALFDAFFPSAVMEVNPKPLPPVALPQFDLLPAPAQFITPATPAQSTDTPFELLGGFAETISPPPGSAQQGSWLLAFTYDLRGHVTEAWNRPPPAGIGAGAIGTLTASYSMEGLFAAVLIPSGASVESGQWWITGTMSTSGSLVAIVFPPDPASGTQQIDATSQSTHLFPTVTMVPLAQLGQPVSWTIRAAGLKKTTEHIEWRQGPGEIIATVNGAGAGTGAVHEALSPINPSGGVAATWTKDATFSLAGTIHGQLPPPGPGQLQVVAGSSALFEDLTGNVTSPSSQPGPLQTPISFQGQSQGQFVDVMANPGPIQMPPGGGSASAGNDVFVVVPMNATEWIDSSTPGNTAVKASIAGGCSDVSVPTDLDSESACLDLGRHMLAGFLPADIRPWFASSK